jgi:uncharacterized membrane protein
MLLGVASAAANVYPIEITGNNSVVNHGQSFDVTFKIQNDHTNNITLFNMDLPNMSPIGEWTSIKYGSATEEISGNPLEIIPNFEWKIFNNTASELITLTFTPNLYIATAGSYHGTIHFDGEYESGVAISSLDNLPITITINPTPSLSISGDTTFGPNGTATITVTNTGNVDLTSINLTDTGAFDVTLNETNKTSLAAGATWNVLVTINENIDDLIGPNSVTINAVGSNSTSASGAITLNNEYCEFDDNNNIDLSIEDIRITGFGDEWDFWYPLDSVEIEIDVKNDANDNINNVIVEWGVYNKKTGKWIIQEEENDFRLKEDERKTLTISFKLDEDIEDFADGDFVFYAKATGEDEEYNDEEICASNSEPVEITIENDFVILDNFKINEIKLDGGLLDESVSCGSEIRITADTWNIGEDEQKEVYVMIYNKELGIDEKKIIGDINEFDNEKFEYSFVLPEDAEEKTYAVEFFVYDENDDIYENSEDDQAKSKVVFKTAGSCALSGKAKVSAELESGGKIGEPLVVKVTITNTEDAEATYIVNAADYTEWASSIKSDESTFILEGGESRELTLTAEVKEDTTEGDKTFIIEVLSGDKLVVRQPVSVLIEKSNAWGTISGITGNVISKDNWHLWGIGLLNLALVGLIIFVGLRVAKDKN